MKTASGYVFKKSLLVLLLISSGCREGILHDLDEASANKAKLILASSGIDARKVREGSLWVIEVAADDVESALGSLEQMRFRSGKTAEAGDNGGGLIQSQEERAESLRAKLEQSLESTLSSLPSVVEARVHLFLKPKEELFAPKEKAEGTASVLLVLSTVQEVAQDKVRQIVAGASGLPEQNVSVVEVASVVKKEKTSERPQPEAIGKPVDLSLGWAVTALASAACLAAALFALSLWRRMGERSEPPTIKLQPPSKLFPEEEEAGVEDFREEVR